MKNIDYKLLLSSCTCAEPLFITISIDFNLKTHLNIKVIIGSPSLFSVSKALIEERVISDEHFFEK